MAKKSKTQKAKAAAQRAAKKAAKAKAAEQAALKGTKEAEAKEDEKTQAKFLNKIKKAKQNQPKEKTAAELRQERRDAKMAAKENRKPKKHNKFVQFFIDVKNEMKRVTWPTRKDVAQWTGVVVSAIAFFLLYVWVLDDFIVTPLLLWMSSFGG